MLHTEISKIGLAIIVVVVIASAVYVAENRTEGYITPSQARVRWLALLTMLLLAMIAFWTSGAFGRDVEGRYVHSPLKEWFDRLASKKGNCCSFADGLMLEDPDWQADGDRYRVRIEGQWVDVPNDALVTEPNRAGKAMVWPMIEDGKPAIRCFMPGVMT